MDQVIQEALIKAHQAYQNNDKPVSQMTKSELIQLVKQAVIEANAESILGREHRASQAHNSKQMI